MSQDRSRIQDILSDQLTELQKIASTLDYGRSYTATLYVSPNGDNSDGLSWATAYNTINTAVANASANLSELTAILLSTGLHNVNLAGGLDIPKHVAIIGAGHGITLITNTNASNTYVLSATQACIFKGFGVLRNGSCDGIRILANAMASVLDDVYFNFFSAEADTGTAMYVEAPGVIFDNIMVFGDSTNTIGLHLNGCWSGLFSNVRIHDCATGLLIENEASDSNIFKDCDFGNSVLAIDIDAGNDQHFFKMNLHDNTRDFDDEVGDHVFSQIYVEAEIDIFPDHFNGIAVAAGGAPNTWGADTQILPVNAIDNPFKIVGIHAEANASEKFRLRFSADSGVSFFDDILVEGLVNEVKRETSAFSSFTEFIFNANTRISVQCKSESGGNGGVIWLDVQEL